MPIKASSKPHLASALWLLSAVGLLVCLAVSKSGLFGVFNLQFASTALTLVQSMLAFPIVISLVPRLHSKSSTRDVSTVTTISVADTLYNVYLFERPKDSGSKQEFAAPAAEAEDAVQDGSQGRHWQATAMRISATCVLANICRFALGEPRPMLDLMPLAAVAI